MNRAELGRRIREARLAKKMTQTEAAGDFITRNMLSQIESSTANPSLKTLEYLAGVLEIPVSSLIPDENEKEARAEISSNILIEGKNLYNKGEYQKAADLAYKAYNMSDKGVYASRDVKTISALLMNRIAEKIWR